MLGTVKVNDVIQIITQLWRDDYVMLCQLRNSTAVVNEVFQGWFTHLLSDML